MLLNLQKRQINIKRSIFFILFLGFETVHSIAQIAIDEIPYGLKSMQEEFQKQEVVVLSTSDILIIAKEDIENDSKGGPIRYAFPIKVGFSPDNSGEWYHLKNGAMLWRLKVKVTDALSTNTYYDKFWLPKGGKFYVYSDETKQYIGAVTSKTINGSRDNPIEFASSLVYGPTVIYEYYHPPAAKEKPIININRIDYGYRLVDNPYSGQIRSLGSSGACQVNINCIEGNNWQIEKPAIARVAIPLSNGTGWCSCSLINNTNQDFKPYVLTANHCLDEQYDAIANNDASQWVFYWNYEYATCANSGTPVLQTTTGATIKANNSVSDFALLELTQDPRNVSGFVPFYMGWDRSGNTGTGGIGIHHPMGDAKKIATYSATPTTSTCMGTLNSNFWMISFIQTTNGYSVMEPGSSGSSLINNQHKIIGQLYGPGYCADIRCENPSSQVVSYGKFNVSWTGNSSANIYRRLDYWLNPNNMSAQTSLDGIMYIPIIGPSTLCVGTSYTFSESNAPAGFTWDKSSNLTITGSGSSVTVTANSSGSGWISIKLGSVELVRKIVEISSSYPAFDYIDGPEEVTPGSSTYTYSAYFEGGNLSSYTWQVYGAPSSWHSITTGGNNAYITFFGEATYQIYVTGENGCGYDSGYMFVSAYNYDEANSYAAYPNPASDLINVEIAAETVAKVKSLSKSATADPVFNIKLLDGQGAVQRCAVSNGKSVQFNVSGLPNGIYYLEINNGVSKKPKSIKVIVKH